MKDGGSVLTEGRQTVAHCVFGQFGHAEKLQLMHDGLPLVFNRFIADTEIIADILDTFAISNQLQNLPLTGCQCFIDNIRFFGNALQEFFNKQYGDPLGEVVSPLATAAIASASSAKAQSFNR